MDAISAQFQSALNQSEQASGKVAQPQIDSLKKTTEEFEAMFLSYLLKVMRSTVETSDTEGSSMGKEIYTDLFDNEVALNIARTRGLGIGEMMYEQLKDQEGVRVAPKSGIGGSAASIPESEVIPPSAGSGEATEKPALPVDGPVSSKFGFRKDPFTGATHFHKGVDVAAPAGTPFHAANSGTVVFAGLKGTYGNTVIIESANGDRSLYAHAAHLTVQAGDVVKESQVIGFVGSTGRSTGAHLHFEAHVNGAAVDPQILSNFQ